MRVALYPKVMMSAAPTPYRRENGLLREFCDRGYPG
jgi:hypothetical protein